MKTEPTSVEAAPHSNATKDVSTEATDGPKPAANTTIKPEIDKAFFEFYEMLTKEKMRSNSDATDGMWWPT